MVTDFTLFIPTHNRHAYLDRILDYYASTGIKIVVADSSVKAYEKKIPGNVDYHYLPNVALPQKMVLGLSKVQTKFVALCADDDFLIPDGIHACVEFLNNSPEYSIAQGLLISYRREGMKQKAMSFSAMSVRTDLYDIAQDDPLERIGNFFEAYESIFYAVHKTTNLQRAYNNALQIKNLYLNEYLSGIIPVILGRYIELPVFYQVREYAANSDDKTTDNMDAIMGNSLYRDEYNGYINYILETIPPQFSNEDTRKTVQLIFEKMANKLALQKEMPRPVSFKKKVGSIIGGIPVIGKKFISHSRNIENKRSVSRIIKNERDRQNLLMVENFIKRHASSIS